MRALSFSRVFQSLLSCGCVLCFSAIVTSSPALAANASKSQTSIDSESQQVDAQTVEEAMRESAKKYSLDFFDPVQKSRVSAMRDAYIPVSYTHLTLPTTAIVCRSRWSPYH